jgi:tripartite-type tricarboxylate transporter receptor subunit TctC
LPGYEYVAWFGVFAPGTTPPDLVARISMLLREAVDSPDMRDHLRIQGVEPHLLAPQEFREQVKAEIAGPGHCQSRHQGIAVIDSAGRALLARHRRA